MADEYVRKQESILAMQVKEDNISDVLEWLQFWSISYSYDEIKSGGALIVYDPNDGPRVVVQGFWICFDMSQANFDDKSIYTYNDHEFNRRFERRN